MKRKCLMCTEEIDDSETTWYSDSGCYVEDAIICESCYLNLMKMEL